MKITKRQLVKIIKEEQASTKKYDSNPALKGGQKNLPDALQKGIIGKSDDDDDEEEKNESIRITAGQLRAIIREAMTDMRTPLKVKSSAAEADIEDAIQMLETLEAEEAPNWVIGAVIKGLREGGIRAVKPAIDMLEAQEDPTGTLFIVINRLYEALEK